MRTPFILCCLLVASCSGQPVDEITDVATVTQEVCLDGPGFPSCHGQCGHLTCGAGFPDLCCACDDGCEARGDCCCDKPIYCPRVPTCEGSCGGPSPDGFFCDTECLSAGDCCGDFEAVCDVVTKLDVGDRHVCAATETGRMRCWGQGYAGQLGYGNGQRLGDDETPASAGDLPLGGPVTAQSIGAAASCVLELSPRQVRCFGTNTFGMLGLGHTLPIGDDEPVTSAPAVNVGGTPAQVSANWNHACVRLSTGALRCWGANHYGQLGQGNTLHVGDDELPSSVPTVNVGASVARVETGVAQTCVVTTSKALRCWGRNDRGQAGYGHTNNLGDNESPASAGNVSVGGTVKDVAVGNGHTCALLTTGAVRCWGDASYGQLGYGNTARIGDNELPSSVGAVSAGGTVTQLVAGWYHTCALLSTGAMRCWGRNDHGQLGRGNTSPIGDNELPSSVPTVNAGGTIARIAAGMNTTCAQLTSGAIRCWGMNDEAQLGIGGFATIGDNELPSSTTPISVF